MRGKHRQGSVLSRTAGRSCLLQLFRTQCRPRLCLLHAAGLEHVPVHSSAHLHLRRPSYLMAPSGTECPCSPVAPTPRPACKRPSGAWATYWHWHTRLNFVVAPCTRPRRWTQIRVRPAPTARFGHALAGSPSGGYGLAAGTLVVEDVYARGNSHFGVNRAHAFQSATCNPLLTLPATVLNLAAKTELKACLTG